MECFSVSIFTLLVGSVLVFICEETSTYNSTFYSLYLFSSDFFSWFHYLLMLNTVFTRLVYPLFLSICFLRFYVRLSLDAVVVEHYVHKISRSSRPFHLFPEILRFYGFCFQMLSSLNTAVPPPGSQSAGRSPFFNVPPPPQQPSLNLFGWVIDWCLIVDLWTLKLPYLTGAHLLVSFVFHLVILLFWFWFWVVLDFTVARHFLCLN